MALVKVEVAERIAVVTLDRPEAMNAMNRAMRRELAAAMQEMDSRTDVAVVILTGAGERAFTAGLDLKELAAEPDAMADTTGQDPDSNPVKAVEQCGKPVIGAINGVAITGGFELALACDLMIAAETARFADTHARVGIMPGWGLSQKLSRIIGPGRAKQLSFTGNFLDARTAEQWGLVNRVVPLWDLLTKARELAADMATIEPAFLRQYKALIDDGFARTLGEGLALEAERSSAANRAVTPDAVAARREAVQQRGRSQTGA
ncbi:MAG: enoyl-CoA hydratase [Sphingomonadaceae bacterium]